MSTQQTCSLASAASAECSQRKRWRETRWKEHKKDTPAEEVTGEDSVAAAAMWTKTNEKRENIREKRIWGHNVKIQRTNRIRVETKYIGSISWTKLSPRFSSIAINSTVLEDWLIERCVLLGCWNLICRFMIRATSQKRVKLLGWSFCLCLFCSRFTQPLPRSPRIRFRLVQILAAVTENPIFLSRLLVSSGGDCAGSGECQFYHNSCHIIWQLYLSRCTEVKKALSNCAWPWQM